MQPFDVVIVTWLDAYTEASSQYGSAKEALEAYRPCVRKTIGYFVGMTKQVVAVATDDDRSFDARLQNCGGISYIPRNIVQEIKVVGDNGKKK